MMDERMSGPGYLEDEPVIIPLELEDGSTIDCHVIAIFDYDGIDYIAILPNGSMEILLFRYVETGEDEISLENIDDRLEWELVAEYFDSLVEREEDD